MGFDIQFICKKCKPNHISWTYWDSLDHQKIVHQVTPDRKCL